MLSSGNADMYVVLPIPLLLFFFFLMARNYFSHWTKFGLWSRLVLTHAHNSATAINLEGDGVKIMDEIQENIPIIKCPF